MLVGVEIGSSRSDVLVQGKSFSIKTIIPYLPVYVSRAECLSLGWSSSLSRYRKAFFNDFRLYLRYHQAYL